MGRRVKVLRISNLLEFDKFYAADGITRNKIVPYNLQQSGPVKRLNKSLIERVKSMMIGIRLSKDFWEEIMKILAHLMKRSPSSAINFLTPTGKWSGHQLDFKNVKAFGCATYAQIKDKKLGPKALKCLFII